MDDLHLLTVTREMSDDKLYGLGKSIAPIHNQLISLGWSITYFSQTDLHESQLNKKNKFIKFVQFMLMAKRFKHESFIHALIERMFMGFLASQIQLKKECTHVHFHDPWIALGFLLHQYIGIERIFKRFTIKPTQHQSVLNPNIFLTQHGFGAYCEAVKMDGVQIGVKTLRFMKTIEKWVCSKMMRVIAPTQICLDQLAIDLDILPQSILERKTKTSSVNLYESTRFPSNWIKVPHVIHNFSKVDYHKTRQELKLPEEATIILTVGRLAPLKQFDVVIKIFADLCKQSDSVHLIILGGGDPTFLTSLAESLGVLDKITFTSTNQVDSYYSAADIYISASLTESFGLANLEALTSGLPCICTRVGGVPEVVQDAALLVEPNQSSIASGLKLLLMDPIQKEQLLEASKRLISAWPTVEEITQTYVQIFQPNTKSA
jgi:glycosyltransferase involved in cell wall biosynthesis